MHQSANPQRRFIKVSRRTGQKLADSGQKKQSEESEPAVFYFN